MSSNQCAEVEMLLESFSKQVEEIVNEVDTLVVGETKFTVRFDARPKTIVTRQTYIKRKTLSSSS